LAENRARGNRHPCPADESQPESQAAARQTDLITAMARSTPGECVKSSITARYRALHDTAAGTTSHSSPSRHSWICRRAGARAKPSGRTSSKALTSRRLASMSSITKPGLPELDLTGSYAHYANGAGIREFSDASTTSEPGISRRTLWRHPFHSADIWRPGAVTGRASWRPIKAVLTLKKLEEPSSLQSTTSQPGSDRLQSVDSSRQAESMRKALEANKRSSKTGSTSFVVLPFQRMLRPSACRSPRPGDYLKRVAVLIP